MVTIDIEAIVTIEGVVVTIDIEGVVTIEAY